MSPADWIDLGLQAVAYVAGIVTGRALALRGKAPAVLPPPPRRGKGAPKRPDAP